MDRFFLIRGINILRRIYSIRWYRIARVYFASFVPLSLWSCDRANFCGIRVSFYFARERTWRRTRWQRSVSFDVHGTRVRSSRRSSCSTTSNTGFTGEGRCLFRIALIRVVFLNSYASLACFIKAEIIHLCSTLNTLALHQVRLINFAFNFLIIAVARDFNSVFAILSVALSVPVIRVCRFAAAISDSIYRSVSD